MTIVCGITPGAESETALQVALAEQQRRGGLLVLVNATRGDSFIDQRFLSDAARDGLEEHLRAAGSDFRIEQPISGREPAEEILSAAERYDAELIVLGLRKRSPVGKLLMGSTLQTVLLNSGRPVLAVPHR